MKKYLLLLALAGIGAAWINKTSPRDIHKFSFRMYSYDGTKIYWGYDITSYGWQEGTDYDCAYSPAATCTFMANPLLSHLDTNGNYFYVSDILVSGTEKGDFYLY